MRCNLKTKVHRKFNSGESVHLRCSFQTDGLEATKKRLAVKWMQLSVGPHIVSIIWTTYLLVDETSNVAVQAVAVVLSHR